MYEGFAALENGLKRKPSEYVKDHIWFTTQPLDYPEDKSRADQGPLEWMEGDKILLFSSDYPHWTYDDPQWVAKHTRPSMLRRSCSATCIDVLPPALHRPRPARVRSGPSEVQAVVLTGQARVELAQRPEPVAGDGEVLIEVRAWASAAPTCTPRCKPVIFTPG